jgi:hypothetical protein
MTDRGAITEHPPDPERPDLTGAALEQRVRRLEDVVATLQDTRDLEERLVERVSERVGRNGVNGGRAPTAILLDAGRRLLPAARDLLRPTDASAGDEPAGLLQPRPPWLLYEYYLEMRAMLRMLLDPRYRLTWQAKIVLLGVVPFILTSWWWMPGSSIPFFGSVADKLVDILLAFLAYKVLARELVCYRQAVAGLPVRYGS